MEIALFDVIAGFVFSTACSFYGGMIFRDWCAQRKAQEKEKERKQLYSHVFGDVVLPSPDDERWRLSQGTSKATRYRLGSIEIEIPVSVGRCSISHRESGRFTKLDDNIAPEDRREAYCLAVDRAYIGRKALASIEGTE